MGLAMLTVTAESKAPQSANEEVMALQGKTNYVQAQRTWRAENSSQKAMPVLYLQSSNHIFSK